MNSINLFKKNKLSFLFGNKDTTNKFPLLNKIIAIYVGVTLLTYILFLIAPFITLIAKTPLYSIKTYLGIIGVALLGIDLFTNKIVWRGKYIYLLFGVCACAMISTLQTIEYGIKDNIFDLCWVVIQFALVYSCTYRFKAEKLFKYVKTLFWTANTIWTIACTVSIVQYILQIGYLYVSDPNTTNPELTRQGFLTHRLFGVFTSLDYAAYISLMLLIVSVYFFIKSKNTIEKTILIIYSLILFLYDVLSGSRSVQIAFVIYVFFFTLLVSKNFFKTKEKLRKTILVLLTSVLSVVVFSLGFSIIKTSLGYIPKQIGTIENSNEIAENPELLESNLLERTGLEGDISNERFKIWGDYLSTHEDIGLFGLSLSNYNDIINEKYPDLYIVEHFNFYSNSDKNDIVYESHNNYIFVWVSTGYIGFALFIVFLIIIIAKSIRYLIKSDYISWSFITSAAVAGVGCVEAFFMNSVFLKLNGPSFVFWFALGILVRIISEPKTENKI